MDRKEYFRQLITLYEAPGLPEQNEIADTGADVEEQNLDDGSQVMPEEYPTQEGMPAEELPPEGELPPEEGMEDTSYMDQPQEEPQLDISDRERKLRLYSLFKNMLNYTESMLKTLDDLELSNLEDEYIKKIDNVKITLNNTKNKIQDYMMRQYADATYEQGIYIYVLLRSELLLGIEILRENLAINKENDENK